LLKNHATALAKLRECIRGDLRTKIYSIFRTGEPVEIEERAEKERCAKVEKKKMGVANRTKQKKTTEKRYISRKRTRAPTFAQQKK